MDLYLDCASGISGNMFLGALFDLGLDFAVWKKEISTLPISGFTINISQKSKNGIAGSYFEVLLDTHEHAHRGLADIEELILKSSLSDKVKQKSISMFNRLATVEAQIHRTSVEKIHFHEVGAIDSIVDIVGSVLAVEMLKIKKIFVSEVVLGSGTIKCAHGELSLPAPATVAILKGADFNLRLGEVTGELVTPTGALVLTEFCRKMDQNLNFKILNIGYGLGSKDFPGKPNVLKAIDIDLQQASNEEEKILKIETNIDDMSPQLYEYVIDMLLQAGALDVYLTNIMMKKNRPAVLLTVLCQHGDKAKMLDVLFQETTTIGVRLESVPRIVLERQSKIIKTAYGDVRLKIASVEGEVRNVIFEYEDCKAIAKKHNIPLKKLYNDLWKQLDI